MTKIYFCWQKKLKIKSIQQIKSIKSSQIIIIYLSQLQMDPGDQVILSYEQYTRLKQYDTQNTALKKINQELKLVNTKITHDLTVMSQKMQLKNQLISKQQLKTQYLIGLLGEIRKAFNIGQETIGHGIKFMKDLEETQFSVIRLSEEIEEDERLPEGFSKSQTYAEIDQEFQSLKVLKECCVKELKERQKQIEFMQKQLNARSSEDKNKETMVLKEITQQLKQQNRQQKQHTTKMTQQFQRKQLQYLKTTKALQTEVYTLKQQSNKMRQRLHKTQSSLKSQQEYIPDIKSKLISLISQYVIYLQKEMMLMSLTAQDKCEIVKNEIREIELKFKNEVGRLLN